MHIVIGSAGTRGDVQPLAALGRGLSKAGFRVTLAAGDDAEGLARRAGLGFRGVGGDFQQVMESDLGREWLQSGSNPLRYRRLLKQIFAPLQRRWIEDADAAVEGCDAVLHYPLAAGFLHAAERRRLPVMAAAFVPWLPSAMIPPLMLPQRLPLAGFVRRWLGLFAHRMFWQPFMPVHQAYRAEVGLPAVTQTSMVEHAFSLSIPHLHLFSEAVLPRPSDWAAWATVSGFAFLDEGDSYHPPAELARFLAAGPPPVYIGFGSMTACQPEALTKIVMAAVERASVRALVVSGWGGLSQLAPSRNVHFAADVPHDWLMARVSAVVHHGGIGTLAAGLRAGRPTVVVPFFGDQPFWARRVRELGVGPEPIARKSLDVERLARAIGVATTDAGIARRADEVGERIRAEDGVAAAVQAVTRFLDR